jgi:DNA (cytosine-5)-methyltransferase 1
MKYLSLFSGIGGFELGIQQAYESNNKPQVEGLPTEDNLSNINSDNVQRTPTCIGYSEIDKYACQIYNKQFANHKNYGDITTIEPKELPDFDLLVGGFPCQAFSVAGKRKGFDDTRGTLFFDIARICAEKRPRLVVLENVKGLLSHDSGKTFQTILGVLSDLGYRVEWQVLNSKNFGVPQNRERVFIIGHLRGTSRPEVFPIGEAARVSKKENKKGDGKLAATLRAGGNLERNALMIKDRRQSDEIRIYKDISETVSSTYGTGGGNTPIVMPAIRRLTPTECERLQGFPDGWTEGLSDTQRYKTLGNAVTVNVIKAIFKNIWI